LPSEDRLTAAVAHDIAHALLDHVAEDLYPDHVEDLVLGTPALVVATVLPDDWPAKDRAFQYLFDRCLDVMINAPYTAEMEREADRVGLFLASCSAADPSAAADLWEDVNARMAAEDPLAVSYFKTHALDAKRPEWYRRSLLPLADEIMARRNCDNKALS